MGFLDDLSRKVANAGQVTKQRTKEISEMARIGALITQNEGKIRTLYYKIGKKYVSSQERDEELDGMVAEVKRLEQEIEDYNHQIEDLRNTQRCEVCGADIPKDSLFCDNCGAPVQQKVMAEEPSDALKCPGCGAVVKAGMRFCTRCGHRLEVSAKTNSEADSETNESILQSGESEALQENYTILQRQESELEESELEESELGESELIESELPQDLETVNEKPVKICVNCGAEVVSDAIFCTKCGNRF